MSVCAWTPGPEARWNPRPSTPGLPSPLLLRLPMSRVRGIESLFEKPGFSKKPGFFSRGGIESFFEKPGFSKKPGFFSRGELRVCSRSPASPRSRASLAGGN